MMAKANEPEYANTKVAELNIPFFSSFVLLFAVAYYV
jgi:hypothetical protein